MFGWFKKKKKVATEEPKPQPEPYDPGYKDDWEPMFGEWHSKCVCHCGNMEDPCAMGSTCKKCGHKDKWTERVVRLEWLESPSRYGYRNTYNIYTYWSASNYHYPVPEPYTKDQRLVYWTEDHCTVKEETKPVAKRGTTRKRSKS